VLVPKEKQKNAKVAKRLSMLCCLRDLLLLTSGAPEAEQRIEELTAAIWAAFADAADGDRNPDR
jgi:hypothetical protein